jgi:hypothetical protein
MQVQRVLERNPELEAVVSSSHLSCFSMQNGKADEEGLVDVIHHHHGRPTHLHPHHDTNSLLTYS